MLGRVVVWLLNELKLCNFHCKMFNPGNYHGGSLDYVNSHVNLIENNLNYEFICLFSFLIIIT